MFTTKYLERNNPNINFKLSVSSNYDWFSNNPRYSLLELKILKSSIKNYKIINTFEDDASVSIIIKKLNNKIKYMCSIAGVINGKKVILIN